MNMKSSARGIISCYIKIFVARIR